MHRLDRSRRRALLGSILLLATAAHAQELTWGVDGAGGSGTWTTTATNWWNGISNQAWSAGATARFAGAPGTVAVDGQQTVAGLIVAASPLVLAPGAGSRGIRPALPTFTVDVHSGEVVVDIEVSGIYMSNDALQKTGPGKITFTRNARFFDEIQVVEGEFVARGGVSSFGADHLYLADDPSVVVTVGPFDEGQGVELPSLAGGGKLGGIIRPAAGIGTVSITVKSRGTSFAGRLEDAAGSVLAVQYASFYGAQTMTAPSPYTGATRISDAPGLILTQRGALPFTPISISSGSKLVLDNATTTHYDRVSNSLPMRLEGGALRMIGHPLVSMTESIGPVSISRSCRIQVDEPGKRTIAALDGLERSDFATLQILGPGTVTIAGLTNSPTGIVGPWLTIGTSVWAAVHGGQELVPYAGYVAQLAGTSPTSHVALAAAPSAPLPSAAIATLTLQNPDPEEAVFTLGSDETLTLAEGGLLTHGAGPVRIQGGALHSPDTPLFLSTPGQDLTIDSAIEGAGLVMTGPGAVTLTGHNSYTGDTVLAAGSLHVSDDAHLGDGERVVLGGGKLVIDADLVSDKILTALRRVQDNVIHLNDHTIDVRDHDAAFAAAEDALFKVGRGRLTITSGSIGVVIHREGELELPGADGGSVILDGGTLVATGRLDWLQAISNSSTQDPKRLSIGDEIGALTIDSLFAFGRIRMHVDVDASDSDHLQVTAGSPFRAFNMTMEVNFRDAGGLALEQPYPILSTLGTWPPEPAVFQLDPDQQFAGWDASFAVAADGPAHQVLATIHAVGAPMPNDPAPDGLRVVAADPTRCTLAWNDNTDLEGAYEVERTATYSGEFQQIAVLPPNTTVFQDSGLTYTKYRYRVRAVNDAGATAYSDELEVDPPSDSYTWRRLLFNQTDPYTGPGADANDLDGDVLPNLLEFALGTSPFIADHAQAPEARLVEDAGGTRYFALEFIRPRGLWGVSYILDAATAPDAPWSVIPAPHLTITDQGDGTERVLLAIPAPITPASPAFGLLRLRVQ